jgi:hypothetical protein
VSESSAEEPLLVRSSLDSNVFDTATPLEGGGLLPAPCLAMPFVQVFPGLLDAGGGLSGFELPTIPLAFADLCCSILGLPFFPESCEPLALCVVTFGSLVALANPSDWLELTVAIFLFFERRSGLSLTESSSED